MDNFLHKPASALVSKSIDMLLLSHPLKMSTSVLSGLGVYALILFVSDIMGAANPLVNTKWYHFPLIVLFILNIPLLVKLFVNTKLQDEYVQSVLDEIRNAERAGMNPSEIEYFRKKLINILLQRIANISKLSKTETD